MKNCLNISQDLKLTLHCLFHWHFGSIRMLFGSESGIGSSNSLSYSPLSRRRYRCRMSFQTNSTGSTHSVLVWQIKPTQECHLVKRVCEMQLYRKDFKRGVFDDVPLPVWATWIFMVRNVYVNAARSPNDFSTLARGYITHLSDGPNEVPVSCLLATISPYSNPTNKSRRGSRFSRITITWLIQCSC